MKTRILHDIEVTGVALVKHPLPGQEFHVMDKSTNPNRNDSLAPLEKPFMSTACPAPYKVIEGKGATIVCERIDTGQVASLIDIWGDSCVTSLGHSHPLIVDAIKAHLRCNGPLHVSATLHEPTRTRYASKLVDAQLMDRVFLSTSGAHAVDTAIKIARLYQHKRGKNKSTIISPVGSFHGMVGFSWAATDDSKTPYHKAGMGPYPDCFGHFRFDEMDRWGDEVAAVLMSPVLSTDVMDFSHLDHLEQVRKWCDAHEALLIYDEVQVGMGRLGKPAAWQLVGDAAKPDLVTIAKGLAGGLPMAACLAHGDVADTFEPGHHWSTFGGNILACVTAEVVLDWVVENCSKSNITKRGAKVQERLKAIPWVKSVDGRGLHIIFQPDWDKLGMDGFELMSKSWDAGLMMITYRRHGAIRFTPPLAISDEELDMAFMALESIS